MDFLKLIVFSIATGAAVVEGISWTAFVPFICHYQECCTSKWINLNTTALQQDLQDRLFGQHLVANVIIKHLKAHMTKDPSKAIALSFHGGPGTGKNYASKIIADSIYKKGMKSKYVHLISATKEFPHKGMVPLYKDKLRELVESSVKECAQSLFIFDEIDKMPPNIIDTVKPYLDFYEELDGTDYRKAMFLFLSDTAAKEISVHTLSKLNSREDIRLHEMEKNIGGTTFNTKSNGMYRSEIIQNHLITAYVPFLPLERKHIKECIKDYLVAKNYYKRDKIPEEKVNQISRAFHYYPPDFEVFSVTGCKRVPEKVAYMMDDG